MKKKAKEPKEQLIDSLMEDLKSDTSEPSASIDFKIDLDEDLGELQGLHPESESKTDILAQQSSSSPQKKSKPVVASVPPIESGTETQERTLLAPHPQLQKVEPKNAFGGSKGKTSPFELQFAQAENMRMAQQRILQLEKEIEDLRKENELLSSANEISRQKYDEVIAKVQQLERQKHELKETNESELRIFKEGLNSKDHEIRRLQAKVDELESRLSTDLRKVRVRERELENRLELAKAEKSALLRAKDDTILELKRKIDHLEADLENYQNRIIEMGQKLDGNQEQFARTVRALRIALTNLEVSDGTNPSITIAPLKKAE